MRLTILGCGTSTGVPVIQCRCKVCKSRNPKNNRLRASAWLEINRKSILIDTSTDLRQQALRAKISKIDAVLFTHPHADHIHGIDELRSFNFIQKTEIPIFGNSWTCHDLRTKFPYIFNPGPIEGGGVPLLRMHEIDSQTPEFEAVGIPVTPLSLAHGSKESIGYRIGSFAYVTDCNHIPSSTLDRMEGLSVLILDCLRIAPHSTHFNLDQAMETVSRLKPKKTYLTHLSHDFDYIHSLKKLPKGVCFAYDGLVINISERGQL